MIAKSENVNFQNYEIAITGVEPQKLEQAITELSKAFNIGKDITRVILQNAPILFLSNLSKNEVRSIKPVLILLSKAGIEFTISKEPLNLLHKVTWTTTPKISSRKIENAKPARVDLQWQNIAIVCPACGETFLVQPIAEKIPPAKTKSAPKEEITPAEKSPVGEPASKSEELVTPTPPEEQIDLSLEEEPTPTPAPSDNIVLEEVLLEEPVAPEPSKEEQILEENTQTEEIISEQVDLTAEQGVEELPTEEAVNVSEESVEPESTSVTNDVTVTDSSAIEVNDTSAIEVTDNSLIELDEGGDATSKLPISEELPVLPVGEELSTSTEPAGDTLDIDLGEEEKVESKSLPQKQRETTAQKKKEVSPVKPKEEKSAEQGEEGKEERYKVFLSQITSPEKKEHAAQLIAELTNCSIEEAREKVNRVIIPVFNDASKEEAESAVSRFKELKIRAIMTKKKA